MDYSQFSVLGPQGDSGGIPAAPDATSLPGNITDAVPLPPETPSLPSGAPGADPTIRGTPSERGPDQEERIPLPEQQQDPQHDPKPSTDRFYPDFAVPPPGHAECVDTLTELARGSFFDVSEGTILRPMHELMARTLGPINRIVSRGTGSVIYMVAAWDDGDGGTQVYELEHVFSSHATQAMRQGFLRIVHGELGPTFTRDLSVAWPSIYGRVQNDFRPRVPPEHPDDDQERWIIFRTCICMRAWQGLPPIDWHAVDADVQGRHFKLVSGTRLPKGITRFDHPANWPGTQVRLMGVWFRRGQRILDAQMTDEYPTVFQWVEQTSDEPLCLTAHTKSDMKYSVEEGHYWAGMERYQFGPDAYMPVEVGQPLVTEDARLEIVKAGLRTGVVSDALKLIDEYEKYAPPQRAPRADDPMMFQYFNLNRSNIAAYLAAPTLPPPFYHWLDKAHVDWNSGAFTRWIVRDLALVDPVSGRVYGGYGGVVRVLVATVLMGKTVAWTRSQKRPGNTDLMEFGQHVELQMKTAMGWVSREVQKSIDSWTPTVSPAIPVGNRCTAWAAKQIRWTNAGGSGSDDPKLTQGHPPIMLRDFLQPQPSQMNQAVLDLMDEDGQPVDRTIYTRKISPMVTPQQLPQQRDPPPSVTLAEFSLTPTGESSSRLPLTTGHSTVPLPGQRNKPPSDSTRRSLSEPRSQVDMPANALQLNLDNPTSVLPSPDERPNTLPDRDLVDDFLEGLDQSTPHPRGRASERADITMQDPLPPPEPVTLSGNTPSTKRRIMESVQVPPRSAGKQTGSRASSSMIRSASGGAAVQHETPTRDRLDSGNTSNFLTMAARQIITSRRQAPVSSAIAASVIAPGASASSSRKKRTRSTESAASNTKRGRSGDRA
ncbi:hypothetical protein FRC08_015305 [Ceratobasidium sp. 394]|nr:hypothetical protein FRC08_015305 [Ceratobasidium sp. 394]